MTTKIDLGLLNRDETTSPVVVDPYWEIKDVLDDLNNQLASYAKQKWGVDDHKFIHIVSGVNMREEDYDKFIQHIEKDIKDHSNILLQESIDAQNQILNELKKREKKELWVTYVMIDRLSNQPNPFICASIRPFGGAHNIFLFLKYGEDFDNLQHGTMCLTEKNHYDTVLNYFTQANKIGLKDYILRNSF